jgi:copper(I)-binding protein
MTTPPPPATDPADATEPAPAARPTPPPRTDIYFRIRRFAPVLVVLFCAGILVIMAVVRPFTSPPSAPELKDPLVGAGGDPAAAYVVIANSGGNDTLVGASTPVAGSVEIQQREGATDTDEGVLVTVDQLAVPGYTETRLQPGGDQLLLVGLTRSLAVGDVVPLTLEFERAGTVTVDAEVATYLDIADRLLPPRLVIPGQDGNPTQPGQVGGQ